MIRTCPILERPTETLQTSYSRGDWQIVSCKETGFTFLANPPDYEQLQEEFAWEKTYESEKQRREQAEPTVAVASELAKQVKLRVAPKRNRIAELSVRTMRSRAKASLRMLDIGCGAGKLLSELDQRFSAINKAIEPTGIEVSKELAQRSGKIASKLGGSVLQTYAIEGCRKLAGQRFDLVVMCSFLEHEAKPLTLLKCVREILADGGAVTIKVPNYACWNRHIRRAKWCGFRFPDHVNYFTPGTLKRLSREAGFSSFEQSIWDRFPLNDNMYAALRK